MGNSATKDMHYYLSLETILLMLMSVITLKSWDWEVHHTIPKSMLLDVKMEILISQLAPWLIFGDQPKISTSDLKMLMQDKVI